MFNTKDIFPLVCKRLELFRAMASNWDIEDDIPATNKTIDIAHKVLLKLNSIAEQHNVELPEPYVYLLCDGQIEFEWDINSKEFDLSIVEDNSLITFDCLAQPSDDTDSWTVESGKTSLEELGEIFSIQIFITYLIYERR